MARQEKTSKRKYVRKEDKIKCNTCRIADDTVTPRKVAGIYKWVCCSCWENR